MTPSEIAELDMYAAMYETQEQAAATIRELEATENRTAAEAKLKIATEALDRIKEADAEININNYSEEDVIDLNDAFVDMWREADQALARIKEVG